MIFNPFITKLSVVLALFCALVQPSASFAGPLTLADAVRIAQQRSPDLRQLTEQFESTSAKKRWALAPSEPTFSITENDLTQRWKPGTEASLVYSLVQPIGFPGRAFLSRAQLSDQAASSFFQMNALKLQVAVNVKTAYYNLQLARKNIDLNNDTRLAYEHILEVAKRRYESGASGQVDYLNAQVAFRLFCRNFISRFWWPHWLGILAPSG
jgi:outer membrane protein TolC